MRKLKSMRSHQGAQSHKFQFSVRLQRVRGLDITGCPPGVKLQAQIYRKAKDAVFSSPVRWRPHEQGSAEWSEELSVVCTLY